MYNENKYSGFHRQLMGLFSDFFAKNSEFQIGQYHITNPDATVLKFRDVTAVYTGNVLPVETGAGDDINLRELDIVRSESQILGTRVIERLASESNPTIYVSVIGKNQMAGYSLRRYVENSQVQLERRAVQLPEAINPDVESFIGRLAPFLPTDKLIGSPEGDWDVGAVLYCSPHKPNDSLVQYNGIDGEPLTPVSEYGEPPKSTKPVLVLYQHRRTFFVSFDDSRYTVSKEGGLYTVKETGGEFQARFPETIEVGQYHELERILMSDNDWLRLPETMPMLMI